MKINELLVESEQLDELSLKGLGQGLGKAVGAVGGGIVQGAKNVWSGMKQGYQAGQAALAPDETGAAPAPAPSATTAPAPAGGGNAYGGEVASNNLLARAKQGTTQDPAAQSAPAPAAQSAPAPAAQKPAPAGQAPAPAAPSASPAGAAADQQSKIGVGQINKIIPTLRTRDLNSVKKNVDATLAKKAKPAPAAAPAAAPAGQAPAAPAAPTQAELDADHERLATGTNESRVIKFRSRFLGMDI